MKNLKINTRLFLEFAKFTFHKANRFINPNQVDILKDSILKNNVLRLVIVVKLFGKYIIVDGQHLAYALKELGMPIECIVVPCKDENEMVELMSDLNRIANNWKLDNYIHAHKELGKKDYIALTSILSGSKIISTKNPKLKIQDCLIHAIYSQKVRSIAKNEIEKGTFTIPNRKMADVLIQQIYDCQRNGLPSNSRKVNEALMNFIIEQEKKGLYNHNKMLKNIKALSTKKAIEFPDNESNIKATLRLIYEGKKVNTLALQD